VAKILVDFAKTAPLEVKGGVVGGKAFDAVQVDALSSLPGKEQLIAMLMSTMNAPLTNMLYVLNGIVTKLVRTLAAVQEKKESE
jgi:large subunit ribosomal protein L10